MKAILCAAGCNFYCKWQKQAEPHKMHVLNRIMWRWSGQLFDLLVQWLSGICSCRWRFGYFKVELCTHASNLVWGLGIQLGNEERENMKCPLQPIPNLSLFMFSFWPLPISLFSSHHWRVYIHFVPFLSASLFLIALLLISQPFVLHSSISFSLTVFPFVLHHLECLLNPRNQNSLNKSSLCTCSWAKAI